LLLLFDERDQYLIEASRFFSGSDREIARRLRSRLLIYREGRWRRTRSEIWNPHETGRLEGLLWQLLRVRDAIPCTHTIRLVLGRGESEL
jgi:hypothetical protein